MRCQRGNQAHADGAAELRGDEGRGEQAVSELGAGTVDGGGEGVEEGEEEEECGICLL